MRKLFAASVLVIAFASVCAPAQANRTDYPHIGEIDNGRESSPFLGRKSGRPWTMLVGDSLAHAAIRVLRARGVKWEISAVQGRDVGNLPWYVRDRVRATPRIRRLVIALGTNATPGWSYDHFRRVANMVPASTKVIFVTTYRDPKLFPDSGPFRGRASVQATYSRWMHTIDRVRRHTCVADWRSFVQRYPSAVHDGVHASPSGIRAWARIVRYAVNHCR